MANKWFFSYTIAGATTAGLCGPFDDQGTAEQIKADMEASYPADTCGTPYETDELTAWDSVPVVTAIVASDAGDVKHWSDGTVEEPA